MVEFTWLICWLLASYMLVYYWLCDWESISVKRNVNSGFQHLEVWFSTWGSYRNRGMLVSFLLFYFLKVI